jgi:hypothetical protein
MSTITEIEAAIERLPAPQVAQLAAWLDEFRGRERGSASAEYPELDALIGTWREDEGFDAAMRAFEQVDEASWK